MLNEAELTLPEFIRDYEAGCARNIYTDDRKPDITKTPPPRFDLIDVRNYANVALQFSRGCPFSCEFCDIVEMFGRKPRTKLPQQFLREMEIVYETGYRNALFIVDDNFTGARSCVKELLVEIIKWQQAHDYPFSLFTEASIDCAGDDELLDLMVDAGFDMIFVGIETPSKESLKEIHKTQNLRLDLHCAIEKIQRRGIEVTGGFIIGFDADPPDIFDLQVDFIQKAGISTAMVGLLTALPSTRLYRRLKKEKRLLYDSSGNNTHELELNFVPRMPRESILQGYKHVISTIYNPLEYFSRCMTLLRRLPTDKRKTYRSIKFCEIKALLRSLIRQTFSGYGLLYWKFLLQALFHNPKLFPEAVAMAIKGYHYFKITDEIVQKEKFSILLTEKLREFQEVTEDICLAQNNNITQEIEKYGRKIKTEIQKKYRQLNHGMQQILEEVYNDFEKRCDTVIQNLKEKTTGDGRGVIKGEFYV